MFADDRIPLLRRDGTHTSHGPDTPATRSSVVRGMLLILVSALCQSLFVFFSHLSEMRYGLRPPAVLLVRAPVSIALSLAALAVQRGLSRLAEMPAPLVRLLCVRGLVGATCAYCLMASVAYLAAGTAMTILSIAPFVTTALSAVLFGSAFTPRHLSVLLTNFAGVALVMRPGATSATPHATGQSTFTASGIAYAFMAVLAQAGVFLLVKKIGRRVHTPVLSLSLGLSSLLLLPFLASLDDVHEIFANPCGTLMAVLADTCGFIDQNTMALGLHDVNAGTAAVIRTLNVPITFTLGFLVAGESMSWLVGIGALLVMVSTVGMALLQLNESGLPPKPALVKHIPESGP